MKKILLVFILLLFLSACARTSLADTVTAAVASDETLPAGSILCYGYMHENAMSRETLSDYLGLAGYPEFADKIEELAVYSSLTGDYAELCVLRLYDAADMPDAVLFLERRITEARRALKTAERDGYAETAFVKSKGNTAALFMMPDNEKIKKSVF